MSADARHAATIRVIAALAAGLAFACGVYLLLEAARPSGGLISFTFLALLPAAVSALVAYLGDPMGMRDRGFYLRVPLWLLGAVILASVVVLREGVICILMLSPPWLIFGLLGSWATWRLRGIPRDGRSYCMGLLALPLVAMQIEPMLPLPAQEFAVVRQVEIAAPPAAIWPLLRGIPDVRPGEGRWNLSQDVIGIPRPRGARLVGEGPGATRWADWGRRIRFREQVTEWTPGRAISWRFLFDDVAGWAFTDRHLMPDSPYFRVTTGGYRMEPLAGGRTRLIIETRYRVRTPVNRYGQLWGELFLGDLERNLLGLVKDRAERAS